MNAIKLLFASMLTSSFSCATAVAADRNYVLAQDGRPGAVIVVAEKPTRSAQFAAYELQAHLNRITGANFAIATDEEPAGEGLRLLVGESKLTRALGVRNADFKPQEYLIRFLPDAIILAGRDKEDRGQVKYNAEEDPSALGTWPDFFDAQGTMYAAYDFLEQFCHVRWFDHTETGTDIPPAKTLTVKGKEVRRAPAFRYRHIPWDSSIYDANVSLWRQDSDGFKRWEEAAYGVAHKSKSYAVAKRACVQRFRYRMREGGEKCLCNHSLYHYYDLYWQPRPGAEDCFVSKRPELFAQGYEGGEKPPQMCYTSEALIELVAQEARDYFDKGGYPEQFGKLCNAPRGRMWGENFFAVEPMDNSLFCKCPKCRELLNRSHGQADNGFYSQGRHSDYFFNFVNEVAKRVRKTHPDKRIVTLAYMTHACPPESLRLEPNVAVQFCFASNRFPAASRGEYENDLKALAAWADEARTSGRPLYLWLYYGLPVQQAHTGKFHGFPAFFAHSIGEQFKLFHKYSHRGFLHCGYGQEVESYVTYKLMDDPALSVDVLLDEYFGRLYGAAGARLKKLYLGIERTYCDPSNYPEGKRYVPVDAEVSWKYLGTEARMAEFAKLMQQANDLAKTDLEKRRVALFELGTWNYMDGGRKKYIDRMAAPIPSVTAQRVAAAGGDPLKADWTKATPLWGPWYNRGQARPAARKFSGRLAHDSAYLYVELIDPCETSKLVVSPAVSCFDDWELFVAAQRSQPYRQFMIGPTGKVVALLNGEVNWQMYVDFPDHGLKVASDTSAPDKWITRLAIPLKNLVKGGVAPGGKFYLNIVRVSAPALTPAEDALPGDFGLDTWVSHCTVHETDRLAEIRLE
ncbi:MAG: DUF4838 domain-containing protein [Verrucomicrobia bacterium]|nr:DUF4838 domain-containing protein [Verrucomicrobiota bacterium]